jgi:type I restriction modification DNA specificity domain protein (fragment)
VLFSSRAPIGYCAIAENDICTNQGFKSIVPNENTDSLFLYYLLKSNVEVIANNASGTTFLEISGKVMEEIEVSIPEDKNEQIQIAKILDAFDRKIENNLKLNDYLSC